MNAHIQVPAVPPSRLAQLPGPALRAFSVLTVLNLVWQFATAGPMVPPGNYRGTLELHAVGAIVLHVLTGLVAAAVLLLWRTGRASVGLAALAVVVFGLTFAQAALGDDATMWLHVPGAMILTIGAVWLLTWSFLERDHG